LFSFDRSLSLLTPTHDDDNKHVATRKQRMACSPFMTDARTRKPSDPSSPTKPSYAAAAIAPPKDPMHRYSREALLALWKPMPFPEGFERYDVVLADASLPPVATTDMTDLEKEARANEYDLWVDFEFGVGE
jgi:hypothetical protein